MTHWACNIAIGIFENAKKGKNEAKHSSANAWEMAFLRRNIQSALNMLGYDVNAKLSWKNGITGPAVLNLDGQDSKNIDYDQLISLFENLKESLPQDSDKQPEPEVDYFEYYSVKPNTFKFRM